MSARAPNIRRLKRRRKIEQLIAALRYEDKIVDLTGRVVDLGVPVRCEAVLAVSAFDDPVAIEALAASAIDDEDERVRRAARSELVDLLQSLDRPKPGHEDREIDGEAGPGVDTQVIRPVQQELARLLLLAGGDALIEGHESLLLGILRDDPHADMGEVIVQEMVDALADPRPEIVERAVRLIVSHAPGHGDAVIGALRDPARAAAAAKALGEIGDNRALGPLVAELRSEDPTVRRACVWALGEMADARAIATLLSATSDGDYEVRQAALEALDKLGSIAALGGDAGPRTALGAESSSARWSAREPLGADPAAIASSLPEPAVDGNDANRPGDALPPQHGEAESVSAPSDGGTVSEAPADQADAAPSDALAGEPMAIAASDGTMLHAEAFGKVGAPTIVLVHGWTTALRLWTHQIRHLAEDFRVVVYDLRGHGRSEPARSGDYSFDTFGDDLEAVLAACVEEGASTTVVGHSLGATSIAAWAQRYDIERRVSAAALLHPRLDEAVAEHLLVRLVPPNSPDSSDTGSLPGASPRIYDAANALIRYAVLGPSAGAAEVAFYAGMLFECPPDVRARCAIANAQTDLESALRRLTVPTLVMAGELDRLTPPVHARTIAAMLPDLAALVELPETAHLGPLEQPDEFNRRLRALAAGEADTPAA